MSASPDILPQSLHLLYNPCKDVCVSNDVIAETSHRPMQYETMILCISARDVSTSLVSKLTRSLETSGFKSLQQSCKSLVQKCW